jgi:hypothetical protein
VECKISELSKYQWTTDHLLYLNRTGTRKLQYSWVQLGTQALENNPTLSELARNSIIDCSNMVFVSPIAVKSNDAAATMQTLLAWLDHSKIAGTSPTLRHFCDLVGDPELKQELVSLETSLYAAKPESLWSGGRLLSAVQRARKNSKNRPQPVQSFCLPELNPGRKRII